MDVFSLYAKIGLDSSAYEKGVKKVEDDGKGLSSRLQSTFSSIGSKVASGAATMAKAFAVGIGTASTGLALLGKKSIELYSDYEQLVGGVETLFGKSSDKLMDYAKKAYMTAGLSANDYMSTVTSFSASLLQGLGGDTDKAVEIANLALTDMSDNANKMGTSMEMIQNAYQGFAKDNFEMLDNLKLGYGGTAGEMARLINETGVMGSAFEATAENVKDVPFDKMIEAIHKVQTEMGITGTTALEASTTIQGSFNTMRAALTNFLTGLADPTQDFDTLLGNLVDSVVTFGDNLIPRVEMLAPRLADGVTRLLSSFTGQLPGLLGTLLPALISGATSLLSQLAQTAPELISTLADSLLSGDAVTQLANVFVQLLNTTLTMLPQLAQFGLELLVQLVSGMASNIGTVTETLVSVILQLAGVLTTPENLTAILNAGIDLLLELLTGIVDALPQLISYLPTIILSVAETLLSPDNLQKLQKAGIQILVTLISGLGQALPELISYMPTIVSGIWDTLKETDWLQLGKDILQGMIDGIKSMATAAVDAVKNVANRLSSKFKELLGIASPSKLFRQFGIYLDKGLALGITSSAEEPVEATKALSERVQGAFSAQYAQPAAQRAQGVGARAMASAIAQEIVVTVGFDLDGIDFARGLNPYLKRVAKEVGV